MITEAVVKYGKWDKVVGLCNVPVIAMMKEPIAIGYDAKELVYQLLVSIIFIGIKSMINKEKYHTKGY